MGIDSTVLTEGEKVILPPQSLGGRTCNPVLSHGQVSTMKRDKQKEKRHIQTVANQAWRYNIRVMLVYQPPVRQPGFIDTSSRRESEEGGDMKLSESKEM